MRNLLGWGLLGAGAWYLYNRHQGSVPPPPVGVAPKAPEPDRARAVMGTTDVKWGAEYANARANEIRLKEGWWLRSLQA